MLNRKPYHTSRYLLVILLIALFSPSSFSQPYTANDPGNVPAYNGYYMYGINPGYYGNSWDNRGLANIAAGNTLVGVPGAGCKTFRLNIPEYFTNYYGYDFALAEYAHYFSLGVRDQTVFVGFPEEGHKDPAFYSGCSIHSQMFSNMYDPIWDAGENGTPVNDNNFYALYLYKVATRYKGFTKFWEIMNEPDFDVGANGYKDPGLAGNWWENNPPPCDLLNMRAPIYNYIRMLRISYEVIKYVDPTAYVSTGGIGYPSFLDAILRNSDNPVDGTISTEFPLKGGAYFDVLSYHNYPMYYLRYWNNAIGGFTYTRHSDSGVDTFISIKNKMQDVLASYGYDNSMFPKKHFICTENNISRKSWDDMIGSVEAQRNYIIKAHVRAQQEDIKQLYIYLLGDIKSEAEANDPYQLMGLYKKLEGIGPLLNGGVYQQQLSDEGIANKTVSDILRYSRYNAGRTAAMGLPSNIGGGAFTDSIGNHTYVLWAKTATDQSEVASATYSFPLAMSVSPYLYRREWDFSATMVSTSIPFENIPLTGAPIFLSENLTLVKLKDPNKEKTIQQQQLALQLFPNPTVSTATLRFKLTRPSTVKLVITDMLGREVRVMNMNNKLSSGIHTITIESLDKLASGTYYCRFETEWMQETKKISIIH